MPNWHDSFDVHAVGVDVDGKVRISEDPHPSRGRTLDLAGLVQTETRVGNRHAVSGHVDGRVEKRVEQLDVIALEIVVDVGLPVAREFPRDAVAVGESIEVVSTDQGVEQPDFGLEGRRLRIETDEDEWTPRLHSDRSERVVLDARRLVASEIAGRLQGTIPSEGPTVITTHEIARAARSRPQQDSGSMRTDVVEGLQ